MELKSFNFQKAAIQQYRTVLKYPKDDDPERNPLDLYTWKIGGEYTANMNILGLVFFSGKKTRLQINMSY